MKTNFLDLLKTQREVNEVVNERLKESEIALPEVADYLVAMHVEFFEFINEIGIWKWWKQSHKMNKERILDELADIMAFFLSIVDKDVNTQFIMDDIFQEAQEEMKDFQTTQIIQSISVGIEYGETDLECLILMGLALEIARRVADATWEEIKDAYLKNQKKISIDRKEDIDE